ncbi:MAG: hypothetical protein WBZ32_07540 [Candidatus Acidiferrales bacterium]|jgi:hypothetical protein
MSTQICLGFTDDQWKVLRGRLIKNDVLQGDEKAWDCAIKVLNRRIRERFLSCIEALETTDSPKHVSMTSNAPADCSTLPDYGSKRIVVPGFAIMALCSLLLETLQSFRDAKRKASKSSDPCIRPKMSSNGLIKDFLKRPSFGEAFKDPMMAKSFVCGIRNGILHEAETRRWIIKRDKPQGRICERAGSQYVLNRTMFYQALRQEFDSYLGDLGNSNNVELRKSFVEKMDNIVEKC